MKLYLPTEDLLRPLQRVTMPHTGGLNAPGGRVHVVARCNSREYFFTTPKDFAQCPLEHAVRLGSPAS